MKKHSLGFMAYVEMAGSVTDSATVVSVSADVPVGVGPEGVVVTQTLTASGASKRHGTDKFNSEVAIKLATGRALASLSKKMIRQGNGLVKCNDDNRAANEAKAKQKIKIKSKKKNKKNKKSSKPAPKQVRELVASTS